MTHLTEKPVDLEIEGLPGEEWIRQGLADLASRRESVFSLLVAIGYPRLRGLGVGTALEHCIPDRPELRLYRLLVKQEPREAYSQYNAMIRRLVSFERALEHRLRRQQ